MTRSRIVLHTFASGSMRVRRHVRRRRSRAQAIATAGWAARSSVRRTPAGVHPRSPSTRPAIQIPNHNTSSFYGCSCANDGKGVLNISNAMLNAILNPIC
eukprot:1908934-Pyramimonas_sp.AAC.2